MGKWLEVLVGGGGWGSMGEGWCGWMGMGESVWMWVRGEERVQERVRRGCFTIVWVFY